MIWCRYSHSNRTRYGLVEDDVVLEADGNPFDGHQVTGTRHKLSDVKLLVPFEPKTFYCAGVNYLDHVVKMAKKNNREVVVPSRPEIGYRANNALIAHEEDIVKPADSTDQFQYEGELVAVFGKRARKVSKDEALDCVLGWTIGNDVSERTWQRSDRTFWRSKNADTFKPMGPWIVTDLNPSSMQTTIRLNGKQMDSFATGNMIFDVADFIAETTKYITIHPGDMMWLGTDGIPENMKIGDVCEIEISGIGTLRNKVVAEVDGA